MCMAWPCFLNGRFCNAEQIALSIYDLGLLRGYGVFDFTRTYNRQPFHLSEHLIRLERSAASVGLSVPHTASELEALSTLLIAQAPPGELTLRFVLTGGISPDGLTQTGVPTFAILTAPVAQHPPALAAITAPATRTLTGVKSLCYLGAMPHLARAKQLGAHEVLYVTPDNLVLEGATTNIFIVQNGTLITPRDNILRGITRAVVLRICPYPIEERALTLTDLLNADEAFLTSSTREILPLTHLDGQPLKTGPLTHDLMRRFREYAASGNWALLDAGVHA